MDARIEGAFIGVMLAAISFVIVWIKTRADLVKSKAQAAIQIERQANIAAEIDNKQNAFILDQATKALAAAEQQGRLQGQIDALVRQLEAANTIAKTRDGELGELRNANQTQAAKNTELTRQISDIEAKARDLSSLNAEIRGERDKALSDNESLLRELGNLREEVPRLTRRVEKLEHEKSELVKAIIAMGGVLPEGVQHDVDLSTAVNTAKAP